MASVPELKSQATIRTLPYSRRTCLVSPLSDDKVDHAFAVIADAARRGDNVGVDEIPTIDYFKYLLQYCVSSWLFHDVTSARDNELTATTSSGNINCVMLMLPSRFVRSTHPTVCQAIIVTSEAFSQKLIRRELAQIACEFILAAKAGYSACLMEVFQKCVDHVLAYREEGFLITAVVPSAGKLSSSSEYVNSYVMYKDLCVGEQPIQLVENDDAEDEPEFTPTMLPLPSYLPVNYRLKNGDEIIIRAMRSDEVPLFYNALKMAASSDNGYGLDELPNQSYFARWYVHNFYNLIFEQRSSGKIMYFANFGPSLFARSTDIGVTSSILSDGNNVLPPEFRGRGLSEELSSLQSALSVDCGFKCMFGETAATNIASLAGMKHLGAVNTGSIPKGIYFRKIGWVDLILIYVPYGEDRRSLREIIFDAKL